MMVWEPGQKLQHQETGEKALVVWPQFHSNSPLPTASTEGGQTWKIDPDNWCPVDAWPDPVAEARERVELYLIDRHDFSEANTLRALLTTFADDLRILLDAKEGADRG